MLSELFYWLLNMSIMASIVGVIILLLGEIQRIPRRLIHLLWIIPFIRMWIPVGIKSPYSLMSLISKFTTKSVTVYQGSVDYSMTNFSMAADTYFPITYKAQLLASVFRVASIIWLVITALFLLAVIGIYCSTKSELKDAQLIHDNIYLSHKVTSPAVYGIVRERIILPKLYAEDDLKFVLLHEQAHIKRKDNLWRMLAIVTACIHWFNPLSWLFLKSFLASLELACDEAVLANHDNEEKKSYATALLNCAESKTLYASAFGGAKTRVRIERILSYRKISAFSTACLLIFTVLVGYVLLTNAI